MNINKVEAAVRWSFRLCSCGCPIASDRASPYCVPCWAQYYRTYTETIWDRCRHKQSAMGAEGGGEKAMAPS